MRDFITFQKSIEILDNLKIDSLGTKKVFISNSLGQVLASDIVAFENSPEFPTSGMDGYAIKFEDIENELKIIDKNPAGFIVEKEVLNSTCIKTFTGALMPNGSDTLVPIENVEVFEDKIKILKPVQKGFAVRNVGENYKKDEVLIKKGTVIGFSEIGVMASLNIPQIDIFLNPTIAVASTGSEILDLGVEKTNASQIRSSNHLTLEALFRKKGAEVLQMGPVDDDFENITNFFVNALKKADIVVTTGGVSVGDYDLVQDVIKDKLKAKVLFHGVLVKPGMHILVATKSDKIIVALPGFAYSSTITAILYVLPLIFKFRNSDEKLPFVKARIKEDIKNTTNKKVFKACNVEYKDGLYEIDFIGKKEGTSAILTNMLGNPALLVEDENSSYKSGELVDILLLNHLK